MTLDMTDYFEANKDRMYAEWIEFLEFKSISADPAYEQECRSCAEWLQTHIATMGFETRLHETDGKPLVLAERVGSKGQPTVLYYGHYDVQPADPLELWESDPFVPEWRRGRLYARGAQDNKGQTFYVLKALEALLKEDKLQCGVKLILEGEEESGSKGIFGVLNELDSFLTADVLMVCDTSMAKPGVPTITMGLRGIYSLDVHLGGLERDLHSGTHGGMVKNPATELVRLLSTIHSDDGGIAVKGYYDGVAEASETDRSHMEASGFDAVEYKTRIGVKPEGGESGRSPRERVGFRPTIEINGLGSGYQGAGSKTIIPKEAMAKITSRLVGGQDPERCMQLLMDHLSAHAPKDLTLSFPHAHVHGPALLLSSEQPMIERAQKVLKGLFEETPVLLWQGGSIPIVASLLQAIQGEALIIGFGLDEDNIHSPNESFSEQSFKDGFRYACGLLAELGSAA